MKPYSDDIREKIIKVWLKKEDTISKIALRFDVGKSTVNRYIRQYRKTGSSIRRKREKGNNIKLDIQADIFLQKQIQKKPEITLEELRKKVEKKLSIRVSLMTISRHLKKIKYTRKKKLSIHRNKIL